jgi:membrane protease YdiL (CAAX protease family)
MNSSPLKFFLLVFALSIPIWLIGAMAERGLPLPMNLPVSALQAFCPITAALILVYRKDALRGVRRLLKRVVDYKRIRPKIWYVPIILLLPSLYLLSYWAMRLMGLPLPAEPRIPFLLIPILFAGFFIAAAGEEAGWMGYTIDPLQERWSALTSAIVLGLVWGIFHIVPDIQAHHGLAWIAWQHGVYAVALRVLIVWLYNNTRKSVFTAILVHDTDNVSWSLFPNYGSHYDPAVTGAIAVIAAAIVTFLWGSRTLARYRYG